MRHRIIAIVLVLSMARLVGQVPEPLRATRVIDFSEPARTGNTQFGYRVHSPNFSVSIADGVRAHNGTPTLSVSSTGIPVTLSQVDGFEFDLISLELAEYSTFAVPEYVDFVGTKANAEVLEFRFTLDGIIDGEGPLVDFETVVFPASWTGLSRVQLIDSRVAIDNITVRGLDLATHHNTTQNAFSLELVAEVSRSVQGVTRLEGDTLYLEGVSTSIGAPSTTLLKTLDLTTGLITGEGFQSRFRAGNLFTGESAEVSSSGLLTLEHANGSVEPVAQEGEDGVDRIQYPFPADGKVLFVNPGFQGEEQYAVFIATPGSITPVIMPDSILPDGGTPGYYPRESYFTGNSFAVPSSTSESSDSLYILSFNNGPLLLSPRDDDPIPGTGETFDGRPELEHLSDTGATFLGRTREYGGFLVRVSMAIDGTWTAALVPDPGRFEHLGIPGRGAYLRHQSSVLNGSENTLVSYGPVRQDELTDSSQFGLTVSGTDGTRHLMIQGGTMVAGFGIINAPLKQALVEGGWFYAIANNLEGRTALIKGRVPQAAPKLRLGEFLPMNDGTVRFMVHNLSHGKSYRVERSESLAGLWQLASTFTAGSDSRSVFGAFQHSGSEFYRVVELE